MNHDHPVLQECYEAKAKLSQELGPQVHLFCRNIRLLEAESKKRGIRFVDLSQKESSSYAKHMSSGPLPKSYWKRKPISESWDPIAEEIKVMKAKKKATKLRRPLAIA